MQAYTIHFETLGCRLNQDETEGAAQSFLHHGFRTDLVPLSARSAAEPAVVLAVVNTCTVTGKAEQKARRLIRLLLEKYPAAPVLVTGCYAQVDAAAVECLCPERVVVLPGTKKHLLARIAAAMHDGMLDVAAGRFSARGLRAFVAEGLSAPAGVPPLQGPAGQGRGIRAAKPVLDPKEAFSLFTTVFQKHSRSSLKVQDGCDCACAFCRIHQARGASVSLPPQEVVRRVQELERSGMHEVVLTGVNLSQYAGSPEDGARNLAGLLRLVLSRTASIRIRLSSLYPQGVTDELCGVFSEPRVQPSFHLSIQSGSEAVLSRMRRPHSALQVEQAVRRLRAAKKNPFLSCDIIAGFPGESDEDFEATKALCTEQRFAWIHAFPFSPRPGTPAFSMRPQVPERVKGERVRWLTEAAIAGKLEYIREWEGAVVPAIVEAPRPGVPDGMVHVVTHNFLHARCPEVPGVPPGAVAWVRIGPPREDDIRAGKETECAGTIAQGTGPR